MPSRSPEMPIGTGVAQKLSARIHNAVLLVTMGLLWGTQPALIKALTERGLPEVATLGLTMVFVAFVLAGVLAWRARMPRLSRKTALFMTVAGGTEYAGPLLVAFLIAKHIDAGLLTLIMFTAPIFTVAAAAIFGVERLDRYGVLGCVCGLIGLSLIVFPQDALPSPDMLPWCIVALSIPMMYAVGSIYVSKAWPEGMDAMQVAFGGALLPSVLLLPFWAGPLISRRFFETSVVECVIFAALIGTVIIEMVLYFYTLRHSGPVFASFANFLAIVTGFVAGALFFDERPSHWIWSSNIFFSLALALILLRPAKPLIPDPVDHSA